MDYTTVPSNKPVMEDIRKIRDKKENLERNIKKLEEQEECLKTRLRLFCRKCEKEFFPSEATLLQTHHWVSPRGCIEGGYWNEGEKRIRCPHCGNHKRLLLSESDPDNELVPFIKDRELLEV